MHAPPSLSPAADVPPAGSRLLAERFEAVAAASGLLVWEWDYATGATWRNGPLLQRLGYPADAMPPDGATGEFVPYHWWMARLHPDDLPRVAAGATAFRAEGEPLWHVEYRFRRADGGWATLVSHARTIFDAADRPVRAVGMILDVTTRAEALAALRASEARLAALAEHAPVCIDLLGPDGSVQYASPCCGEIAGRPVEALLGDGWADTLHPEDRPGLQDEFARLLRGERTRMDATYRVVRPDGSVRWVQGQVTAFRPDAGAPDAPNAPGGAPPRPAGFVSTNVDVTDRRAAEERLRHAQQLEAVGQLAGGVAHDFNNLLTTVAGNAELAAAELAAHADGAPADAVAFLSELVADVREAAARAAGVTRQLLAFSRKQVLQPKALTLDALVRGALPLARRLLGEGVALDLHLADGVSTLVLDPVQFTQVLLNLAANARDAMRDAPSPRLTVVTADVTVEAADDPGTVQTGDPGAVDPLTLDLVAGRPLGASTPGRPRGAVRRPGLAPGRYGVLVVADAGHGMDAETRRHIFQPFFTTKPAGFGTGLGLATVYGVVRQSQGYVYVDSAPGEGTAFVIYLPVPDPQTLAQAAPAALPNDDPAAEAAGQRSGHAPGRLDAGPPGGASRTVLVVEDEAVVRRVARRALVARGYEVLEAADGREALALWSARREAGRPVDALVTDVVMPGLGGPALAAQLRAERPSLPVVLVSGYSGSDRAAPHGAVWLEKPFAPDALTAALSDAFSAAGG